MVTSLLACSGAPFLALLALLRRYLALESASVPASRLGILLAPLGTGAVLTTLSVFRDTPLTLPIGAKLALGTSALGLGEDSRSPCPYGSKSASRLVSVMLPKFKGILPLSSREYRRFA